MKTTIFWNGGRYGRASFLIGFSWVPQIGTSADRPERLAAIRQGRWMLHVYLGLWVLTLRSSPDSHAPAPADV